MTSLVVDADVARASGMSGHARASSCRDALDAIVGRSELGLAFDAKLYDEWGRHASNYAMTWLTELASAARIRRVSWPEKARDLNLVLKLLTPGEQLVAKKDEHLVMTAVETDFRIVSLETASRHQFCRLADDWIVLKDVHWVSPTSPECLPWLKAAAPKAKGLCLRKP
jgi:hypothetical protein